MGLTSEQRATLLRDFLWAKNVRFNSAHLGWQKVSCYSSAHYHGDRNPSASVNLRTGYYKCFGCGMEGDAVSLTMQEKGIDFKSAIAILGASDEATKEVETWI